MEYIKRIDQSQHWWSFICVEILWWAMVIGVIFYVLIKVRRLVVCGSVNMGLSQSFIETLIYLKHWRLFKKFEGLFLRNKKVVIIFIYQLINKYKKK